MSLLYSTVIVVIFVIVIVVVVLILWNIIGGSPHSISKIYAYDESR